MMVPNPTPTGRSRSGKAGGTQTLRRHGRAFFAEIGRKGGKARKRSLPAV